jgi:hypothetical protein
MLESQHTEWTETWRDDDLHWVCGFANANAKGRVEVLATAEWTYKEADSA